MNATGTTSIQALSGGISIKFLSRRPQTSTLKPALRVRHPQGNFFIFFSVDEFVNKK